MWIFSAIANAVGRNFIGRPNYLFDLLFNRVQADGGVTEAQQCTIEELTDLQNDNLLSSASLVLTPSSYKEGKLYSVIPENGDGDFTFTRATSATRVNAEGLIETASVLGSELVVNGDFATNSIWTTPTGWSISNGTLQGTNANAISATQSGFSFLNKSFKVEYTITEISQGGIKVFLGGSQSTPQRSAVGTYVEYIDITSGNSTLYIYGINFTGKIDNVSVKEVITNNIPRIDYSLGGCPNILLEPQRTNLALQSSSFDSASWSKSNSSVTANSTTSPSGITDADTLTADGTSNRHEVTQLISFTSGLAYTFSVYIKKNTNDFAQLTLGGVAFSSLPFANFNVNNGTLGSTGGSATSTITSVGNGWYRCTLTATATATQGDRVYLVMTTSPTSIRRESNTLSTSVYLWGAQLEQGAYSTSYIPTTTASVTRNFDSITRNNIYTNGLITAAGGTWFVEIRNNRVLTRDAAESGLQFTDNSGIFGFRIKAFGTARMLIAKIVGGAEATLYFTLTDIIKVAIKWNGSTADVFVNGVKVVAATAFTNTAMQSISNNNTVPKYLNQMALFPTPLTDDQLEALTGEGFNTYAEMASYYNYTLQ
jgi:hypothetical protein